jgi:hypothetical protein
MTIVEKGEPYTAWISNCVCDNRSPEPCSQKSLLRSVILFSSPSPWPIASEFQIHKSNLIQTLAAGVTLKSVSDSIRVRVFRLGPLCCSLSASVRVPNIPSTLALTFAQSPQHIKLDNRRWRRMTRKQRSSLVVAPYTPLRKK